MIRRIPKQPPASSTPEYTPVRRLTRVRIPKQPPVTVFGVVVAV